MEGWKFDNALNYWFSCFSIETGLEIILLIIFENYYKLGHSYRDKAEGLKTSKTLTFLAGDIC